MENSEKTQLIDNRNTSDDKYAPLYIQWKSSAGLPHIILKNEMSEVKRMHDFFKEVCTGFNIDNETFKMLNLAVEEWVVNVVSYAYPKGTHGLLELAVDKADGVIMIKISDKGMPFDPTQYNVSDLDAPLSERKLGGLGIHLVKSIMDSISYERTADGYNILRLTKIIET
ncbi:MAG: ATP-binding protein [Bacteroidaceae bacterium]|nr:ATP-binding protein [Bacteroidaceae bacterium]